MARQGCMSMGRFNHAFVVVVAVVICMAMVMASSAYGQPQQQCSFTTLMPCLKTVRGPYPPRPDQTCCGAVMNYDPTCICSEVVNSKDYPLSFIKNVLAIPKACGRYQLSGYQCGKYTIE